MCVCVGGGGGGGGGGSNKARGGRPWQILLKFFSIMLCCNAQLKSYYVQPKSSTMLPKFPQNVLVSADSVMCCVK